MDMDTFELSSTDLYDTHFGASATASGSVDMPVVGQYVANQHFIGQYVMGQYFDQDLIGSTGEMLNGFYESGQMWALLIGIILGYSLKSFSSYG